MDSATPSGIKNANGPKIRVPKSTATAFELIISDGVNTIKYEKFMKTYNAVITGTEMRIERGIFLKGNLFRLAIFPFDGLKLQITFQVF